MNLTIEYHAGAKEQIPICVHSAEKPCKHFHPSEIRRLKGTCVNRGLTSGACMIASMPARTS